MYTTTTTTITTTHRLCSGSATGIIFHILYAVNDPVLLCVILHIDATSTNVHCFCYKEQEAAVLKEVVPLKGQRLPTPRTLLWNRYLAVQRSAVGTITYKKNEPKKLVADAKATAAPAQPPQTVERAAAGAVGFLLSSFCLHHAHLSIQRWKGCAAGI